MSDGFPHHAGDVEGEAPMIATPSDIPTSRLVQATAATPEFLQRVRDVARQNPQLNEAWYG